MKKADYPAAHSMDTTWFAVDADGHVAEFGSGEAGAVPEDAFGEHQVDVIEALRQLPISEPRRQVVYDLDGRQLGQDQPEHGRAYSGETLLFLRDEAALAAWPRLVPGVTPRRVQTTRGVGVIATLAEAEWEALHAQSLCLGCGYAPDQWGESPSRLGLFSYDHLTENWIAGPYGRVSQPSRPLKLEQLPPELQRAIGARFDKLCFLEHPRIQPVAHLPCQAWGEEWLDDQGVQRSLDTGEVVEATDEGD